MVSLLVTNCRARAVAHSGASPCIVIPDGELWTLRADAEISLRMWSAFLQQAEGCQMANAGVPAYLCLDPYR